MHAWLLSSGFDVASSQNSHAGSSPFKERRRGKWETALPLNPLPTRLPLQDSAWATRLLPCPASSSKTTSSSNIPEPGFDEEACAAILQQAFGNLRYGCTILAPIDPAHVIISSNAKDSRCSVFCYSGVRSGLQKQFSFVGSNN